MLFLAIRFGIIISQVNDCLFVTRCQKTTAAVLSKELFFCRVLAPLSTNETFFFNLERCFKMEQFLHKKLESFFL